MVSRLVVVRGAMRLVYIEWAQYPDLASVANCISTQSYFSTCKEAPDHMRDMEIADVVAARQKYHQFYYWLALKLLKPTGTVDK